MTVPVEHLIVGPDRHGVVRFGVALDAALRSCGFATVARRAGSISTIRSGDVVAGSGIHLQFTDTLFGADAEQAVAAVAHLAAAVRRRGGRVTATLHDLPQASDGANHDTRARAYAALTETLDGVVVSSDHERNLLHDIGVRSRIAVVPLPVAESVFGRPVTAGTPSVAVFGFIYPGKGHAEVLDAMRGLPSDVGLLAIGEPSDGHEYMVEELERTALAQGRPLTVTGHICDDELVPLMQSVTVPVAHHRHVSASGSLNSWLAAGRRPLVPSTRYTREIAARNPRALWLFQDDGRSLAATLREALDDPGSTWLAPGTRCLPTPAGAAEAYRRVLRSVHR